MRRCVVMIALVLLTAGCGGPDPGPVFDNEGGRLDLACMAHQPAAPGARYTDPVLRETGTNLALLRYYTAHGAKPYCDGAPAGEVDRAWGQAYVDLGGTAVKVPTVLG